MKLPALVLGIAILSLSCAGSETGSRNPSEQVIVQNDNWQDVVVFVVTASGTSQRLGDVKGVNLGVLRVPAGIAEGSLVRILVEPIGSDDYFMTDQIVVSGTQAIFLRISPYLSSSSWTIHDIQSDGGG